MTGRTSLLYVCIAAVATYCTYRIRNYPVPPSLQWPAIALDYVHFPALTLSAVLSGNYHNPPDLLRYGLVFLTWVLLLLVIGALLRLVRNRVGPDA